ncbi:hypothetical protein HMPREF1989_00848 [Porphyromonas gingivalis F0566]|nr:hypothetical protein HMPREF1989_00848 [Porphyromonas gingivalis F0566]
MPLLFQLSKKPFSACDLYTNHFQAIYKWKTICIFIANDLYINRFQISFRSKLKLKKFVFSSLRLQNPLPFRCLFGIIPNSSSLLKTFLARIWVLRKHKGELQAKEIKKA